RVFLRLRMLRPSRCPLFPYTTLFRSVAPGAGGSAHSVRPSGAGRPAAGSRARSGGTRSRAPAGTAPPNTGRAAGARWGLSAWRAGYFSRACIPVPGLPPRMAAMDETDSPTSPGPAPTGPRHWPHWVALGAAVAAARLPWGLQRFLGGLLGRLAFHVAGSRRRAARTNLELCFPDMPAGEREALLRASFVDLGIGLFEFARAWWGNVEPMRRTARIEGLEAVEAIRASGRGVLLVSVQLMTLEMCGRLMCDHLPLAGMYRRHRGAVMEWAVKRGRLRYATAMFGNHELRPAMRHLKKGGMLWYAPDQD